MVGSSVRPEAGRRHAQRDTPTGRVVERTRPSIVARLSDANVSIAKEIIGRYPRPKSALIPLLHLAQEQDGHLTNDAMTHIAELIGHTPAEVLGTATFYEMFKFEPVGKYVVNICQTMSCLLLGADRLMHHAEEH